MVGRVGVAETVERAGELERLVIETRRLRRELERLRAEHDALRGSALIWISMYERQLMRANAALAFDRAGDALGNDRERARWRKRPFAEEWALLSAPVGRS